MKTGIILFVAIFEVSVLAADESGRFDKVQNQVGMQFALKKELLLKGVKLDLKANTPDHFVLVALPGIGGPEIFDLGSLPAGIRIKVVGLIEKKRLFQRVREYEVVILAPSKAGESRVRVSSSYAFRLYQDGVSSRAAPRLSAEYFAVTEAPSGQP